MKVRSKKYIVQSGQALVLVLLSLAVVVTIVLFILSRSVTDIAISDSESQAVSAFSAAEAGVEQALVIGADSGGGIGDSTFDAKVTSVARGARSFIYPIELNSGDVVTLWLKSQDVSPSFNGNSLKICWGKSGTPANLAVTPAIEASVYYESGGSPATARIFRATADPNTTTRSPSNSFSAMGGTQSTIDGQTFPFCTTLDITALANKQFVTVRMFYNTNTSHPIAFDSTNNAWLFPTQGVKIDSTGTSGQSNRKVQVFQGWPEVPGGFLFGIYSPAGLTK